MNKLKEINCPSCGEKMEKGYICGTHQIFWDTKEKVGFWPDFKTEGLVKGLFIYQRLKASRCTKCRMIISIY